METQKKKRLLSQISSNETKAYDTNEYIHSGHLTEYIQSTFRAER